MSNKIDKVLVANRGEIAVRIMRACRELDVATVAVYSRPDRTALHVQLADEAVCVGDAPPQQSYLNIDAVIAAARATGADAIHPGYGFLAENHRFAERVEAEGLIFIGPPATVIRAMGSKLESRETMQKAGVAVVPGSKGGSDDATRVAADAARIEGPIFVKASAGGGGKGLRLVTDRRDIDGAIREAIGEAKAAFGDGTVYIERRVENPRHIEFQILADMHGNVVHLFERECSIQRRHQKVLEETPSRVLTPALREAMGQAAVTAASAVGYVGAGTIEFMLDPEGKFYFLEMNTRIQVEHPLTEMTTGVDLVQWQIRIAGGEKLGFAQNDLEQRGHSIECRIYAEDETQNFMPSCGVITRLFEPAGPGIRIDSGVYELWEVGPHYDPIMAKIISYGGDRETARQRMLRALEEYTVHGPRTNIDLHRRVLEHPSFIAGDIDTTFLDLHAADVLNATTDTPDEAFVMAALIEFMGLSARKSRQENARASSPSVWDNVGAWEIGSGR